MNSMIFSDRFDSLAAKQYDRYARTGLRYRKIARALLDAAGPLHGRSVLELGCRTGLLTGMLAEAVGPKGQVTAVDDSHHLVAIAKDNVPADNVKFVMNDEDDMDSLIAASTDAAFSNTGFWHYRQAEMLESVRNLLKPGGRFYFNVSGGFFDFKNSGIGSPRFDDWPYTQADVMKKWVEQARKLHPEVPIGPTGITRPMLTASRLTRDLHMAGFKTLAVEPLFFEIPRDDELAWLQISAWTEGSLRHLTLHERDEALHEVFIDLPPDATFIAKWVTIVAEKIKPQEHPAFP